MHGGVRKEQQDQRVQIYHTYLKETKTKVVLTDFFYQFVIIRHINTEITEVINLISINSNMLSPQYFLLKHQNVHYSHPVTFRGQGFTT